MKKPEYPKIGEIVNIKGMLFKIVYDESCDKCYFHRKGYCEVKTNRNIHCKTIYNYPISYKLIGNSYEKT